MHGFALVPFLVQWQFWALEAQFAAVVVTTVMEVRHLAIRRPTAVAAIAIGIAATCLAAGVPPRTNRIFYDEQIYQGVARNLSDMHRAQMCNDGSVEYGRLQCFQGEYNKEPYGYPYLLSVAYRIAGVSDVWAHRMNNAAAGLTACVAVALADMLFADVTIAVLSGLIVALLPMQLQWSNTAASEPTAALVCGAAALAAVQFARTRRAPALAWTVALTAFALTIRPEGVMILPVVALAIALFAPGEWRMPRVWAAVAAGAALGAVALLHLFQVSQEPWGAAAGVRMSLTFAARNLPTNFWFYFRDERFPSMCGVAAVIGAITVGPWRARVWLLVYFLAFWGIFIFFYAGSYNYGADVRYSLLSYLPLALLAGAGFRWAADWVLRAAAATSGQTPRVAPLALAAAVVIAQSLWYFPLVRATGEEAWAARADVAFARRAAARLPPHSIVLTHNPSMFHVWNVSAAQLSLATGGSAFVSRALEQYAGGVYLHWNFWCTVPDPAQNAFCRDALARFPHTLVDSARERNYEYALYRIDGDGRGGR